MWNLSFTGVAFVKGNSCDVFHCAADNKKENPRLDDRITHTQESMYLYRDQINVNMQWLNITLSLNLQPNRRVGHGGRLRLSAGVSLSMNIGVQTASEHRPPAPGF